MGEISPSQARKTWFITGASRGFGRALAEAALRHGDRVLGTVRGGRNHGLDPLPGLETIELDVTDPAAVKQAVDDAWQRTGLVDILVNNAGYGVLGAIEEVPDEDVRHVFETNVFGLMAVTRAALPHLRKQRSGHILNLSSVGGLIGIARLRLLQFHQVRRRRLLGGSFLRARTTGRSRHHRGTRPLPHGLPGRLLAENLGVEHPRL